MLIEPPCACKRGYRDDRLVWVIHSSTCAGSPRLQPPPPRQRTDLDRLADLRVAFRNLKRDVSLSAGAVDCPARRDWPARDPDLVTQELTVRFQLELVLARANALVMRGCAAAKPLAYRVAKYLATHGQPPGADVPDSFTAPPIAIVLPTAVRRAIERLMPVTPPGGVIAQPQPGDSPEIARDRRLVAWFAELLEG